jgi:tRNA dimethylallyltransferase
MNETIGYPESKPRIVILSGATGSGKSKLAELMCLSNNFPVFEIVIADSRQIYRDMTIGTDKPAGPILTQIPHHLLDIVEPDRQFSAAEYREHADKAVDGILTRDAVPLFVGGTGLYLRVLTGGLIHQGASNPDIRKTLNRDLEKYGETRLYGRLKMMDPDRADSIHPKDTYRIIRALEMLAGGTNSVSAEFNQHGFQDKTYDYLFFVLNVSREILYKRIDMRVDRMVKNGLIAEVEHIINVYGKDAPAMSAIGYRQILQHLNGEITKQEAIRLIKRDTRRFSKRQVTWFKKEPHALWIDHDPDRAETSLDTLTSRIGEFLNV